MIRGNKYSINEVLSKITNDRRKVDFDGDLIYMNSMRYKNFKFHGIKCVKCGLEGKYFVKEKSKNNEPYHFNLYAINEQGHEILMTKDHIIPKAQGGKNRLSNYQTMCVKCNNKKGDGLKKKIIEVNDINDVDNAIDEILNGGNPRKIKIIKFSDNLILRKSRYHWLIKDDNGNIYNRNNEWEISRINEAKRQGDIDYLKRIRFKFKESVNVIRELTCQKEN